MQLSWFLCLLLLRAKSRCSGQPPALLGVDCVTSSIRFSFLSGREERVRKEEEEQKRRRLEIAEKQARKMEAFLEEKEKEVVQLQVRAAGASWGPGCQNSLPGSHVEAVGLFSTDFFSWQLGTQASAPSRGVDSAWMGERLSQSSGNRVR